MAKKKKTIEEEVLKLMKKYGAIIHIGFVFEGQDSTPWLGRMAMKLLARLGGVPQIRFIKKNVEKTQ